MKCPIHITTSLEEKTEGTHFYHECPECHGIWARHRTLRAIIEDINPKAVISMPRSDDTFFKNSNFDTNNVTKCPLDGEKYYEHKFGSVMIDICPKCDGIWFDPGELEKIKQDLENDEIPDSIYDTILQIIATFLSRFNYDDQTTT